MDVKEDLSPVEGTPSKEVNSRGAGQNVYVSLDCGECPYETPKVKRKKAKQKLKSHQRACMGGQKEPAGNNLQSL